MNDRPWNMPSPAHVLQCIETWRSLDLRAASDLQVREALKRLTDDLGDYVTTHVDKRGSYSLYRVRSLDSTFPWTNEAEYLHPPEEKAQRNRCNLPGTPILYCAPKKVTAIEECLTSIEEANPSNEFVLIYYRVSGKLRLARIVGSFDPNPPDAPPILSEGELVASQILREFLRSEFTKPVGRGTEYLYKISAAICDVWFQAKGIDGFLYPSVAHHGRECFALLPHVVADKRLELEVVERRTLELRPAPIVWRAEYVNELNEQFEWYFDPSRAHLLTSKSPN